MLENLAKVIRQTNQGAQDIIAAPIKRIDALEVAQWAINDAVRESPRFFVDKTEGAGGTGMGMGGMGRDQGAADTPVAETPAEREKQLDDELRNGRYIGDTGLPL